MSPTLPTTCPSLLTERRHRLLMLFTLRAGLRGVYPGTACSRALEPRNAYRKEEMA